MDTPDHTPSAGPAASSTVDVATLSLRVDERGRLFVVGRGEADVEVHARRSFPWSMPDQFITLRSKDGTEVVLIESLSQVPTAAGALLTKILATSVFVPRITRVDRVNMEHGYQLWTVHTDAGPAELRVQEREDIRFLGAGHFTVKDANGNVYEIADLEKLDERSRRELARVV